MAVPSEKLALTRLHHGKTLFSVFYEPSTRTRMSFGAAAQHLGMSVVATENAREFSSAVKGESLEDTIRVLCEYYPDVIALRHYEVGAAERAARHSPVPIINAGDGAGQHPTQAVLDLYTIHQALGAGAAGDEALAAFVIGPVELELMKPNAVLMHPLPRRAEIPPEVDSDPRAWYFRQAGNGMFIRMALLEWIFEGD